MIKRIDFYFEISKEAKLATEGEDGYSECYLKLGFDLKTPMEKTKADEIKADNTEDALSGVSSLLKVPKTFLRVISEEEYNEKAGIEEECSDESSDFHKVD